MRKAQRCDGWKSNKCYKGFRGNKGFYDSSFRMHDCRTARLHDNTSPFQLFPCYCIDLRDEISLCFCVLFAIFRVLSC